MAKKDLNLDVFDDAVKAHEEEKKAPAATPEADPSIAETALKSGVKGLTAGFDAPIAGGVGVVLDRLAGAQPEKNLADLYREYRDLYKTDVDKAQAANPITAGVSEVVGAAPQFLVPGANTVKGMTALAALQGLGNSKADLTKGEFGQAAQDTAVGAGTGLALSGLLKALPKRSYELGKKGYSTFTEGGTKKAGEAVQEALEKGVPEDVSSFVASLKQQPGKQLTEAEANQVNAVVDEFAKNSGKTSPQNLRSLKEQLGNLQAEGETSSIKNAAAKGKDVVASKMEEMAPGYKEAAKDYSDVLKNQLDKNLSLTDLTSALKIGKKAATLAPNVMGLAENKVGAALPATAKSLLFKGKEAVLDKTVSGFLPQQDKNESPQTKVEKAPLKLSKNLYEAHDQELDQVKNVLNDNGLGTLGQALDAAIQSKNQNQKNAVLFAILQTKQARKLLYQDE